MKILVHVTWPDGKSHEYPCLDFLDAINYINNKRFVFFGEPCHIEILEQINGKHKRLAIMCAEGIEEYA